MWEFYTPRQGNTAAISKNHITLPQSMVDCLKSDYVRLALDRDNHKLLIQTSTSEQGLKISNRKVLARQFLNHFDLNIKGNHPCTYSKEDKGIVISLT